MSFLANNSSAFHSPSKQTTLTPDTSTPSPSRLALFSSPPPQQPAQRSSPADFTVEEISDSETYPSNAQILHPYATEEPSDTASESDASEYQESDTAVAERRRYLVTNHDGSTTSNLTGRKRARTLESDIEEGTEDRDTTSEPPRSRRRIRALGRGKVNRQDNHIFSPSSDVESEMSDAPPQHTRPFWASEDLMDVDGQTT